MGNLGTDHSITVADTLLARNLIANNHLLWISGTPRPDLGGAEEDENNNGTSQSTINFVRCIGEAEWNADFVPILWDWIALADDPITPEISNKGSYRNVCVQLDLNGLAIAAVLLSHRVNELEGTRLV